MSDLSLILRVFVVPALLGVALARLLEDDPATAALLLAALCAHIFSLETRRSS